ncbi:bifunctional alpha,alpha-trehalose-phosphate synthase (UDP-forming)/trehalose-phosphatase [Solitalea koreensis]|uniref:Alpha,alpha-trehalose-phosphate synthase n=1 Tax=Solitalea koreensis TaxID=543615 RepID=A0A521BGZ8_9SPHI|nr:bifunctional alpha,alpha-trehalose-phosphate synthase (UDP-forming)/trehalose-phosphatase [Solitalea koreensis]SMO46352.1 trehalose 6-phosphate synthase /trehalose 6-phosphatase [Solitalea koreensis]
MDTSKTVIVSNRLPVKVSFIGEKIVYHNSEGGLATGLGSIFKGHKGLWIGWPGAIIDEGIKDKIIEDLCLQRLVPVFLTDDEINKFYEGFSNETLWPLFHYFSTYAKYNKEYWESYKSVNQKYADEILKVLNPGDRLWVHDYQLMLVPQLIQEKLPDVSIGFFLHIPFPSYEIFRLIPWRDEILNGLVGADLIGFHTYDYSKHFLNSCQRILGFQSFSNQLIVNDRPVLVDAFPISIDYQKFHNLAANRVLRQHEKTLIERKGKSKLMISVDRLDYSKGILNRLMAFEQLLEQHPEYIEKVIFLQLVVPSRDTVEHYKDLKEQIDQKVSNINARYSTMTWQPIYYFYRSFSQEMLSAIYKTADIALVTPMRDGMNLVSKEYVASRIKHKGVLVLSEMAGASKELSDAIIINPNDIDCFTKAIVTALKMPVDEQIRRMTSMQQIVSKFNVYHWVRIFMKRLEEVKTLQRQLSTREVTNQIMEMVADRYNRTEKRLLFLDYDGTLVEFNYNPLLAKPDSSLLQLISELAKDKKNTVILISGRKYETLDEWFGLMPIHIVAEHGAWIKQFGKDWKHIEVDTSWKNELANIMLSLDERTPGSFIEEKTYSLAWHYRKVEEGLGELRSKELVENLKYFVADKGLQVLQGNKVIEVKSVEVNKGKAAKKWLDHADYDFILAVGDDYTDEDTFKAMPKNAVNIKVGSSSSAADFFLHSPYQVRVLLKRLIE